MEKVKEVYEGALISIHGEIYEIEDIGESPAFSPHGEIFLFTLKHQPSFADKLADLTKK